MLLLLISLFLNYGLFHCNQETQANFNMTQLSAQVHRSIREIDVLLREFQQEIRNQKAELKRVDLVDSLKDVGLLDYSITPMWWKGNIQVDETGRNNKAITFLPTPVGYGMSNTSEDNPQQTTNLWENLNSLPGIQLNSSSGPLDIPIPEHLPRPDYPLEHPPYPSPTFPPSPTLPPPTAFTHPSYAFPVPPTAPSPSPVPTPDKEDFDENHLPVSPVTWVDPFKLISPTQPTNDTDIPTTTAADARPSPPLETTTRVSILSPSPPLSFPVFRGPFTYTPKTRTIFNFFMMSKRMQERTKYTTNKRITEANRITPITNRPRQIGSTLSKAQAWVRNRQWMKTPKVERTSGGSIKEGLRTTVTAIPPPELDQEYIEGAETAYTGVLFTEDDLGFLQVTYPSPTELVTSPPTTAGDVLNFARNFTTPSYAATAPTEVYHEQMEQRDEGFLVVFLLEITRMVFQKRENDVRDVLHHSHYIMNWYYDTSQIAWMGQRIMDLCWKICDFCSASATHDMEILQTYAGMINQMLKERKTEMSDEVNSIIDYADLMYEDDEGEELFEAVREFEKYPNVTKTSREICFNIMASFINPFKRLKNSVRMQRLLDAINNAIIQRFDKRRSNGELLMLGGTIMPDLGTTKPNHSRKRKRVHNSLKQRITIKRHLMNRTRHHDGNEDTYRRQFIHAAKYPRLRRILPITRHQKRFRIMTPRQLRSNAYLNNERPTKDYFYRRLGRPIHPPNEMLQFFPQVTKESENRTRVQPTEVTQHLKESESQKRPGRMNVELRRIDEDSSYSDDEALLKTNLRGEA